MDYIELYHSGIKGMHWGIRRYQNEDGTRTSAGKKHEQKLAIKEMASNKGPKKGVVNIANSAARDYYKMNKTDSFKTAQKINERMNRKTSQLTPEQVEAGRYRVARARNYKNMAVSALLAGGVAAGTVATAGAGAAVGAAAAAGGTYVISRYAGGGRKYRRDQKSIEKKYKNQVR